MIERVPVGRIDARWPKVERVLVSIAPLPRPRPKPGCAACARHAAAERGARADHDPSAAVDARVRLRAHLRATHP